MKTLSQILENNKYVVSVDDLTTIVNEDKLNKTDKILKQYNDENLEKVIQTLNKNFLDKNQGHNVSEDDKRNIIYSDLNTIKKNKKCIFKHIIVFTNDKNQENNKTLGNIYSAIEDLKKFKTTAIIPELHVFECDNVDIIDDNETLVITDGTEKLELKDNSNIDTLVFARLSVQNNEKCEHIVDVLQDMGLLVLNPIEPSAIACNKYETALLLKEYEIPQPNFCLMTKEVLYDEKKYEKAMKSIYEEWNIKDTDKNEKLPIVIKILDGHGGTGVALVDGKKAYAILQLIFAVDPDVNLIIQRKEEGDGGDIRVHVLTLRDKQIILGAMKRVKLGGDFRSNVSLGAEAEPIKLTEEQEDLALKTALVSGLPWCAVDIMPLVKGSNKELGDNVILEINASPGTDGISSVLKTNFVNILLNELTDPSTFPMQDKIAGYKETVEINFGNGIKKQLLAKLDTGNSTKATCIEVGKYEEIGNKISFTIDGKKLTFDKISQSRAKAGKDVHERPIIIIPQLSLGSRKLNNVPVSVVEKRDRLTNVLINRATMSALGCVVHPNKKHILTEAIEKVEI